MRHGHGFPSWNTADIRNSFRHTIKMHSIARIAWLPMKVTPLSIFPVLAVGCLLSQALRVTFCVIYQHKLHLTFVAIVLGLFFSGFLVTKHLQRIPELDKWFLSPCQKTNNDLVNKMTETDKVAAAAGTTLMTLLPALLVFGPFPTAEIRAMMPFSTWPALITSGFTLGLATSKMVTLGKNRIVRVVDLCTPSIIGYYGCTPIDRHCQAITDCVIGEGTSLRSGIPQLYKFTARTADVPAAANILRPFTPQQDILNLQDLMNCAVLEGNRPIRIYISFKNLLFAVIQGCLMVALLLFAPQMIQENLVWGCNMYSILAIIFQLWTPGIWILAAFTCTFAASSFFSPDEILHLSPLTAATILRNCDYCSLHAAPPPARPFGPIAQCKSYVMRNQGAFTISSITTLKIQQYASGIIPLFKNLFIIQKSPHPMILILRPAADTGQHPKQSGAVLYTVCCGLVQALLLIILTIFFGSIFGTGILQAAFFITYFVVVTVTSRTYSIYHCMWMEQALSTTIIEYRTAAEHQAIKAIIAGMPSVVVENLTDGSTYGGGYRLDHNPHCPNHPPTSARPCPRTLGRLVGLAVVIFLLPLVGRFSPLLLFSGYRDLVITGMLFVFTFLPGGLCVISKMISELDCVDIHRGNTSATTPSCGPISQV